MPWLSIMQWRFYALLWNVKDQRTMTILLFFALAQNIHTIQSNHDRSHCSNNDSNDTNNSSSKKNIDGSGSKNNSSSHTTPTTRTRSQKQWSSTHATSHISSQALTHAIKQSQLQLSLIYIRSESSHEARRWSLSSIQHRCTLCW